MEYAQARIQARLGSRPREADWRLLEAASGTDAALDAAQRGPLAAWIADLHAGADAHEVEASLRRQLRHVIAELATWMPDVWHAPVSFTAQLLVLRPLAAAAAGSAISRWAQADEVLAPLVRAADSNFDSLLAALQSQRQAWLARAWRGLPAAMRHNPAELYASALSAWKACWRATLPECDETLRSGLAQLGELPRMLSDGTACVPEAAARALALIRRFAFTPAAAFAYLALVTLDGLRLRASFLAHRLCSDKGAGP